MTIPLIGRLLVAMASLLVPAPKRKEWRREWNAELWHRAESGAAPREILRCASGVFRDAAWFRETERKRTGFDLFRKPLRIEALFLAAAVTVCALSGFFRAPVTPYLDARQLVIFARRVPFARDASINSRIVSVAQESGSFSGIAAFRTARDPVPGLRVSYNFFQVLGVQAALGRTLRQDDPDASAVLSDQLWRGRFRADSRVIGSWQRIGLHDYRIVGVLRPNFWFRSTANQYFTPLDPWTKAGGAVARLKPGITPDKGLKDLQQMAGKFEPRVILNSFAAIPVFIDRRWEGVLFASEIAFAGALLGAGFLLIKGLRGWRYCGFLSLRIFLTILGLALLRLSLAPSLPAAFTSTSIFTFWIFLLICSASACLLVMDHRGRCLTCLCKLRKPVSIGSWSSQILDQPATEYLCPAGHGTLYVAETGNAPDHWTVLDESWQDLFAHTEQ